VCGAEKVMLPRNIFRLLVYFAVAAYLSSANADPIQESKAEAAARLSAKISEKIQMALGPVVPMRKSAAIHFPTSLLKVSEWTIGEADLATVLDRKCGH
jgi:hypothetical protein